MADEVQPTGQRSLRQKTVGGVLWVVLQSIVSRGVGIIQQLALAWLLAKRDFGLIGLAYTVMPFVNLMGNPGIDSVLVQRHRRFHLWSTAGFWLGISTGFIAMLVMLAVAPLAAWIYGQHALIGLLCIAALASFLQTLQIVPKAQLQSQLRFRTIVWLGVLNNVLTAALTVLCATLNLGAYSFVIPLPIVAAIVGACYWSVARPTIRWNPQIKRWKYLLGESLMLTGTRIMQSLVGQGDYMVLGLSHLPDSVIGTYVFAYNLAIQAFRIMASSVESVLFPSLSQPNLDEAQQTRAMVRAAKLLALVAVPFCTLQFLVASPVFQVIFPPRWLDAIFPMQVLTIGVMVNSPCWPSTSLLMAQRRFRELLRVSITYAIIFFVMVVGAILIHRSISSVAIAVALWYFWSSPYIYWAAIAKRRQFLAYYIDIYKPFLSAGVASIPCLFFLQYVSSAVLPNIVLIFAITVVFCSLYLFFQNRIDRKNVDDFIAQLAPAFARFSRRRKTLQKDVVG